MRHVRWMLAGALLFASPAAAQTPSPLVSDVEVRGLAETQARIADKSAKAQEAELDARIAKAKRELESPAPTGGTAAPARRQEADPVVSRVQRVGVDGPLEAVVMTVNGQVTVRKGALLPGGLQVVDISADGVTVTGNGTWDERPLNFGQMVRR